MLIGTELEDVFVERYKAVLLVKSNRFGVFFPDAKPDLRLILLAGTGQGLLIQELPYLFTVIRVPDVDTLNFEGRITMRFSLCRSYVDLQITNGCFVRLGDKKRRIRVAQFCRNSRITEFLSQVVLHIGFRVGRGKRFKKGRACDFLYRSQITEFGFTNG